jgi:hypothetical protein
MTRDQWLLTGAWAAMAAAGALSIYKGSQTPAIDPGISKLCGELKALEHGSACYAPNNKRLAFLVPAGPVSDVRPAPAESSLFRTVAVGHPVDPPVINAKVLPFPVMLSVKSDLDGTVLTWTTEEREVELLRKMNRVAAVPSNFSVFRQHGLEDPEKVADLGPKVRSWNDLSAKPGWTYRYWVTLTGIETVRSDRSGASVEITNKTDRSLEATAPAAMRMNLIGGDKTHAFMRIETYDRAKKAWVAKTPVQAVPGEKVAGTGWLLKGLRFDGFTLVADVMDDDGAVQVLSTRN